MCLSLFNTKTPTTPAIMIDFPTYADYEAWFLGHDELRLPAPDLCDDYAKASWILAEVDGYRLSDCLVHKNLAFGVPIFKLGEVKDANGNDVDLATIFHIASAARVLKDETHLTDGTQKDSSGNTLPMGQPLESYYYTDLAWGKSIFLCNFITGGTY